MKKKVVPKPRPNPTADMAMDYMTGSDKENKMMEKMRKKAVKKVKKKK